MGFVKRSVRDIYRYIIKDMVHPSNLILSDCRAWPRYLFGESAYEYNEESIVEVLFYGDKL